MNSPGVYAHAYAALGWHVFPLRGKLPRTPNGFKDATRDPAQICHWWSQWPDTNVGIATGAVSGLSVLDIDPDSGGTRSLETIERERGVLPPGLSTITGGNGVHLIYRYAPGLRSGAAVYGPGLDVRSDGGYIVAPPSIHPDTGHHYEWYGDGTFNHPLPRWPTQWLPINRPAESPPAVPRPVDAPSDATLAGLVRYVTDALVGERNHHLNWSAYRAGEHIAKGKLDSRDAAAALYDAGIAAGLTPRETIATITSGLNSGINRSAS